MADRVVLVTGCSSGIGLALAREYQRAGCRTLATARRPESVEVLEKEGFEALRLDVDDEASRLAAVEDALARAGRIDVLVNNAGTSLFGPLAELPLDDVRRMLETNFVGPLALCQAVFPHMAERRSGRIVNVGSMVGVVPTPWVGAYAGAKAGLHAMSEALRVELAPFGIDVVLVQPGGVRSEVSAKAPCHAATPHYAPIRRDIERRAQASQSDPMEADEFARRVVPATLRDPPPRIVRAGQGIGMLGLFARLPGALRDRLFARAFGPAKLRERIGRP